MVGLCVLGVKLNDVRAAVEREGELTQSSIQALLHSFGGKKNRLTNRMEKIRRQFDENPDGLAEEAFQQRKKQQTLACLEHAMGTLESKRNILEQREASEEASRRAAAVLPSRAVVDKILCYQNKLERQLSRAMSDLERLQRRRQGELVPPPLAVEVAA